MYRRANTLFLLRDDRRERGRARRCGGGKRETNELRTIGARARAKGRRIGMRKLKRAVSPPRGENGAAWRRQGRAGEEGGGSSFVIPARLPRGSEADGCAFYST